MSKTVSAVVVSRNWSLARQSVQIAIRKCVTERRNQKNCNKKCPFISCFSISVIKNHDQGNLQKGGFISAESSRGRRGCQCSNKQALQLEKKAENLHCKLQAGIRENETSKAAHSEVLLPRRPHLLSLLQQLQQLGTKYSNGRDDGGHSHSNRHSP